MLSTAENLESHSFPAIHALVVSQGLPCKTKLRIDFYEFHINR